MKPCPRRTCCCWSCTVVKNRRLLGERFTAFEVYELAVEIIEEQAGPFTQAQVWNEVSARCRLLFPDTRRWSYLGVTTAGYTRHAVADAAVHGLIRCARRDSSGVRCLAWETVRESTCSEREESSR